MGRVLFFTLHAVDSTAEFRVEGAVGSLWLAAIHRLPRRIVNRFRGWLEVGRSPRSTTRLGALSAPCRGNPNLPRSPLESAVPMMCTLRPA